MRCPSFDENRARCELEQDLLQERVPSCPPELSPLVAPAPTAMAAAMNPQLWGNLQHHVGLEKLYAKLPLREFFQLRVVCKEWNRLASDERFLEENTGRPPPIPKPYFCVAHPDGHWQTILTYNAASQEWRQVPMLLPYIEGTPAKWEEGFQRTQSVHYSSTEEHLNIRVFNLHTRVQHRLPPLARVKYSIEQVDAMMANSHNNTFQVFSAVKDPYSRRPFVYNSIYDSMTKEWKTTQSASPAALEFKTQVPCHGSVRCGDVLYMSMYNSRATVAYDLAGGVWSSVGSPCGVAASTFLCTWEGHVYAVAQIPLERAPPLTTAQYGVHVHRLCQSKQVWEEVDLMPKDLCEWLFKRDEYTPKADELTCELEMLMQVSVCEQYVFICVFLEDYFVANYNKFRLWTGANMIPRRFALYNLETGDWQRIDLPFKPGSVLGTDRERIELKGEWGDGEDEDDETDEDEDEDEEDGEGEEDDEEDDKEEGEEGEEDDEEEDNEEDVGGDV